MDKDIKTFKNVISLMDSVAYYDPLDSSAKKLDSLKQTWSPKLPHGYDTFLEQSKEKRGCQLVLNQIFAIVNNGQRIKSNYQDYNKNYVPLIDQVKNLKQKYLSQHTEKNNLNNILNKSGIEGIKKQDNLNTKVNCLLNIITSHQTFLEKINQSYFQNSQCLRLELQNIAAFLSNTASQIVEKRFEKRADKRIVEEQLEKIKKQFPQINIYPKQQFTYNFNKIKQYFSAGVTRLQTQAKYTKAILINTNNGKNAVQTDRYLQKVEDKQLKERLKTFVNKIREADVNVNSQQNIARRTIQPHYQRTVKAQKPQQIKKMQEELIEKAQQIEKLKRQNCDIDNTLKLVQKQWDQYRLKQTQNYSNQFNNLLNENAALKQELEKAKKGSKQLSQHIQLTQNTIYDKNLKIQSLSGDLQQIEVMSQGLSKTNKALQRQVANLRQQAKEIQILKGLHSKFQKENQTLRQKIEIFQQRDVEKISQRQKAIFQQLQRGKEQLASKEQNLSAIKGQLAEMSQILKKNAQKAIKLQDQIKTAQEEKQGMKQQRDNLNEKLQKIQTELLEKKQQSSLLCGQMSEITSKLSYTKHVCHSLQEKGKALQEQIARVKKQKQSLQTQLSQVLENYQRLNQDYQQLNSQFQPTERAVEENQRHLQDQIIQLTSELESTKMKNTQTQSQNKSMKEQIRTLKAEIQAMKSSYQQLLNYKEKQTSGPNGMLTKANHAAIFQTQIFDDKPEQKQILIKHIEDYTGAKIIKSKLLYKYDPLNQTSLHKYLDNKKGLLCVTQTSKAILAAFYPGSLVEKTVMDEGGLIVSVTNDKSYKLFDKVVAVANNKSYRGMVYDQHCIIFGNSQVRLKSGTKDLFSNFGINNAYFDCKGQKADAILNDGAVKQTQFEFCEYYQVLFDEPK